MSDKLLKTINELLNEEKWTRATLNSYSINNFMELDKIVAQTREAGVQKEVQELCEEHLGHTKNSIIALYIAGIIALSKQLVDDSNLIILINIFTDNHKWNIVEYLCNRILEFGENKFALRTLTESYESKNEQEKKYHVWERLIKVDYEEAEIVKQLAEKKEQAGELESAIEYYKKALHRFINKKMFSNVKEIWEKLIEYAPEDTDFFFAIERKIVVVLSNERAAMLLNILFPYSKKNKDWDTAIEILKRILVHDPKDQAARKEIVECFRKKYQEHSQLEEYIRISNLNQNWRNVHDAIKDFEKHISFDTGNYVNHRSWGIGKISNIKDDLFIIDFASKPGHEMSLKMAVNALEILKPDHIWVLKSTQAKVELNKKVKTDLVWALKTIIKSFNNVADMKKIKSELVPDILSSNEWSKWSSEARKILKTDPAFGNLPDKLDKFVVRDKPISFEEKAFNKFKAENNFFDRVRSIQEFLDHADPDSDYFAEMFSYFTGFARAFSVVSELVVSSFLLINKISAVHPYLNPGLDYTFEDLFNKIEDPEDVFNKITDTDLKRSFLLNIKENLANWPEIFAKLFHLYQSKLIIDELVNNKKWDILNGMCSQILTHYKEYRESFVWLARNLVDEKWFTKLDIRLEKILIGMIHLLDITYREINNKRDVSTNKRFNKQIQDFLFKEEKLMDYLLKSGDESITRLFTLVDDIKELDPSLKIQIKHRIKERYPDYKFLGEMEKETINMGLLVTRAGYENKQRDLRRILEVEIPENSKEIGIAMSKGDLRENAEYKAALEKQELLKSAVLKLQEELQKAQIFDENQIDTKSISFGTRARMRNLINDSIEEYFIWGPWESEPSKNIISYLSPLGVELWNHKEGDELKFTINEHKFRYIIDKIAKAQLS